MERAALFWFLCNLKRKLSIPFLLFACCKVFLAVEGEMK